jgi:molybdopterin-guanine dinucleotide biosynthesis protein A
MDCFLLAGGQSRRMGRSKLDLPFCGSDFLTRVCGAAREVFDDVLAVQRNDGDPLPGMTTLYEPPHEQAGAIFGVLRALRQTRDRCFVLAIDYPLITAPLLSELRRRFDKQQEPMLVPFWRGRAQLLCAGYSPSMIPLIEERIAAGRRDLRGLIEEAPARTVAEEELRSLFDGEPLMNVNTPEELQEAEQYERQRLLAF